MKTLFIGLNYHDYTQSILNEIMSLEGDVAYIDIQPRSLLFNVFRTFSNSSYFNWLRKYHVVSIEAQRGIQFEKIIFLQAHQMEVETISYLRKLQPNAEFTLYNWDSIKNHNYLDRVHLFDRVLTFDKYDAIEHGFGYLPLFCSRWMQQIEHGHPPSRSIYTVGNVVKFRRYNAIEKFRDYCHINNIAFQHHLKISPVVAANLLISGYTLKNLSFRSAHPAVFKRMVQESAAVFDIANHEQSGQTMRMMENLCIGKKIITNNVWVANEPFYSPDRIFILNELNFSGVVEFLDQKISDDNKDFSMYHIQSFARRLLGYEPVFYLEQ